ncbi:MAG: radical SAM protein, partial [Candidatus Eisenbacteria bacterium]|nr:radical SAM protein [Candidatus Eisenbacteria bacterium]
EMCIRDSFQIAEFLKKRGVKVGLVTNGTTMTDELAGRCVSSGIDSFQVSLLSDERDVHNDLAGCDCFDRTIEGICHLRKRNATVCTYFVGTARNISTFRRTLELNVLLGVRNVALGRFVPGGTALNGWEELLPAPAMLQEALDAAEEVTKKYPIAVSVSTPILPCLVDLSKYDRIAPGFCAVGNSGASIFAIDPLGHLKVCTHSPVLLGNLFEVSFEEAARHPFVTEFLETLPEYCRDCPMASDCRGGCRSSAHLCDGSFLAEDPYLKVWKSSADKTAPSLRKLKERAPREPAAGSAARE